MVLLPLSPPQRSLALPAVLLCGLLFAGACGGGGGGGEEATPTGEPTATVGAPSPTPPAALRPRELGYRLAPAVPSATFDRMLGFAMLPGSDSEAMVVTQDGQLWRVPLEGEAAPQLFGDVSGRLIAEPGLEEGLLGLAFSPQFETDSLVYLHYTAGGPRRGVLSRFRASGGALDPASEEIVLEVEQPFAIHNGGQIAFGPDGYLYLALGDGGSAGDSLGHAQDLGTLLGSVLRIDVSGGLPYRVPPDNPFVDAPGARPEIYAYGLRNPWRFSFDRVTGDLWAADVGQNRWEEVDRIVAGGNYGWNVVEGPECFRAAQCDRTGFQPPRAFYPLEEGNCAAIGGYVYRGRAMPELAGWFVYGDFCSGRVWAVTTEDESPPVLLADSEVRISSFGVLPDGELAVVTFANAIFRLERATD